MRNPLRVTDRVGDGDCTALRQPEQREPLDTDRVHDELEVVDPGVEAEVVHVPVGQAAPTLVVADQPVPLGEAVEPVRPDQTVPLQFEVGQPVRRLDQWRSVAGFGVRDADAVRRDAVPDVLRQRGGRATRVIAALLRHRGNEPVAAPMDGGDDLLALTVVADRLPSFLEPAGQRRLAHESVAPHRVEELRLGHQPVPVGDQMAEHVEDLGLDVDELTAAAQLELVEIELAILEVVHGGGHRSRARRGGNGPDR